MDIITVKDFMTSAVVSVHPETPLFDAARILAEHHFDGVPVVDAGGKLVGIVTEYDLISNGTVHLPTLQLVLQNLQAFKKDRAQFEEAVKEVATLTAGDVMNKDPLTLSPDATFEEAVAAFRDHHRVNPIPIIDGEKKVVGVLSRFDVLKPLHL